MDMSDPGVFSYTDAAFQPAGLLEVLAGAIGRCLPGLDAAEHVAALVTEEDGEVQITLVAKTLEGRLALRQLVRGSSA